MTAAVLASPTHRDAARRLAAVLPLTAVLRQLAGVLRAMTDAQYTQKPVGVVPGCAGGHVRHCLDHVDALLAATKTGLLDYDTRRRGTDVETQRQAALDALARQEAELLALSCSASRRLRLRTRLTSGGDVSQAETTVGRELAFVLSHTIHHNALLGVIAVLLGVPLPERFGYAPSTVAYLEAACVR